jgi:hypothetical protein
MQGDAMDNCPVDFFLVAQSLKMLDDPLSGLAVPLRRELARIIQAGSSRTNGAARDKR